MKKRRCVYEFRHLSKPSSEAGSSEVHSDEEFESLSASEEAPMDLDGLPMDEEWHNYVKEDRSAGGDNEETRCLDSVLGNDIFVEEYPDAAIVIGQGHNTYSQTMVADEHHEKRKITGLYYPFSGEDDWKMFRWLSSLRVPMDKIDEFFKLPYVYILRFDWPSADCSTHRKKVKTSEG